MSHFHTNDGLGISRLAVHEAGHVAVALHLGCAVSNVTIISDDKSEGCTETPDINNWPLERAALFKIGGIVAEEILFGDTEDYRYYLSDKSEIEKTYKLSRAGQILNITWPQYVVRLKVKCREILDNAFGVCLLVKIASDLDQQKSLNSEDLHNIFESCKAYGTPSVKSK